MSSINKDSAIMREIARLAGKGGFVFTRDGEGALPCVTVGSKKFYADGVFYDPDRSRLCVRLVDAEGRVPSDISSDRTLDTLSSVELQSLHDSVLKEWNDVFRRIDNIQDINMALSEAGGVLRFNGADAPVVRVSAGGTPVSVTISRIDRQVGSMIPATFSGTDVSGVIVVRPFLDLTDRDLGRVASSAQVRNSMSVMEKYSRREINRPAPSLGRKM